VTVPAGSPALPAGSQPVTSNPAISNGSPSRTGVNGVPSIGGSPAGAVTAGSTYSFRPTARDPEGNRLTFTITRKPAWAAFDPNSGTLQGTPGPSDVGSYDNIGIGVTDGVYFVALPQFRVTVMGTATGTIRVTWMPPTQRDDGSALTDLSGYKLYWGTAPDNYPNSVKISNIGVVNHVIEQLAPGTYYVVATAFDSKGVESGYSNPVSKTIKTL
jgi:Putative Ig domain